MMDHCAAFIPLLHPTPYGTSSLWLKHHFCVTPVPVEMQNHPLPYANISGFTHLGRWERRFVIPCCSSYYVGCSLWKPTHVHVLSCPAQICPELLSLWFFP